MNWRRRKRKITASKKQEATIQRALWTVFLVTATMTAVTMVKAAVRYKRTDSNMETLRF
jgi:hypothetical protein